MVSSAVSPPSELHVLLGSSAAAFTGDDWPDDVHLGHGPPRRLPLHAPILSAPTPQLLADQGVAARIVFRDQQGWQRTQAADDPAFALAMFKAGNPLILDGLAHARYLDTARILSLLHELGLPAAAPFYSLAGLLIPKDGALSTRCEPYPTFVWQVHGTATWRVAAHTLAGPSANEWASDWPSPIPASLRAESSDAWRSTDSNSTRSLTPGDVLYIPRGHWHAASAREPSLAVVFLPKAPTWSSLILDYLDAELSERDAWRRPASGWRDSSHPRPPALQELMAELADELNSMAPEQLLTRAVLWASVPEQSIPQLFMPRFDIDSTASLAHRPDCAPVLATEQVELTLDAEYVTLVQTLLDAREPVSLFELCGACPNTPPSEISAVLQMMVQAGIVSDGERS